MISSSSGMEADQASEDETITEEIRADHEGSAPQFTGAFQRLRCKRFPLRMLTGHAPTQEGIEGGREEEDNMCVRIINILEVVLIHDLA